jgi:hypothetical protein
MSAKTIPVAKFRLGRIFSSANAMSRLATEDILAGIQRHQAGDWGDVEPEDHAANERALLTGARIWSVYHAANGLEFWIITEASRESTTVMLPEDD